MINKRQETKTFKDEISNLNKRKAGNPAMSKDYDMAIQNLMNANKTKRTFSEFASIEDRTQSKNFDPEKKGFINSAKNKGAGLIEGLFPFALKREEFLNPKFGVMASSARTLNYMNPFNASVRTDALNFMGFLTKAQKNQEKIEEGFGRFIPRALGVGIAAMATINYQEEGKNSITSTINDVSSITFALGGLTIGRGIGGTIGVGLSNTANYFRDAKFATKKGFNLASGGKLFSNVARSEYKLGTLGKSVRLFGAGVGMAAGFVSALSLYGMAQMDELIENSTKSNNEINRKAAELFHDGQYAKILDSQDSLTMRQAALNKLSKSGLNDRALYLR